ncbi:hypothetical protein [Abyssogena phaseoliformis symbiont]|uniref:hypothetical protein n=1 Tax=Abyssogena phaseoliformis symbiont TaxID=596095 RepID=UPI001916372A|nr:hypothetical protein [Abyssogena phaseoliformis symbiont]MBW5288782.1 hypothetical protein [Candidatus Ruthia sp. Apha_13_S6]
MANVDIIAGNAGADTLTGNGGADIFDYNSTTDGGDITIKIDADGGSNFASPDITITLIGAGITGAETILASFVDDSIIIG